MLFACMDGIAPARVHECCLTPTAVGADAAEDMLGSSPSQDSAEPCSALRGTKLALTIVENEMGTLLLVTATLVPSLKLENLIFGPVVFGCGELFLLDSYAHSVFAAVV